MYNQKWKLKFKVFNTKNKSGSGFSTVKYINPLLGYIIIKTGLIFQNKIKSITHSHHNEKLFGPIIENLIVFNENFPIIDDLKISNTTTYKIFLFSPGVKKQFSNIEGRINSKRLEKA
ncbi:hypothetical protein BpHYR1_039574 [Brachionus plicatilis]|uniref:Uncharacterized protein n=1 Tax=Brachionus plicatilis TaxID=10195 RepID=A0A3M7SCJ1_BRAPC|nr:hypothetical protein BpHYR1_039574 [Brachionus plicatilis]